MKRVPPWFWYAVGALILFGGGAAVYTMTRGLRNNNPGNIRKVNGVTWQGQSDTQNDSEFVQFINATWGIRALARAINTYRNKYGLNTVAGIINRWAPPSENDTQSYINSVAKSVGKGAYDTLTDNDMLGLIKGIIRHENGVNPYSDETVAGGIALA